MIVRRNWIRWGGVGAALCALSLLSCKEAVMEPLTVAAVEVAGGGVNLRLGQTAQLTPTLKSAKGYLLPKVGVVWSSSDGAKASISPSGQVTAVSRGPVTLTASAGGVSGTAAVTVIGVQSISLAPETLSVIVTQTRAMTATTVLDPGVTVTPTWRSLDTTIARVGTDGRVTATSTTGIARIEVTAEDKRDTAVVRVVPVPVVSVVVSPDTATRTVGQTLQLTATPKDSIGGTLTGRVVAWSSSDTSRASVSTAGLVTVRAAGTATITATIEGKTGSSGLTLKVPVADVTVSQTSCTGSGSFSGGTGRIYTSETCEYGALVRDAAGNSITDRTVTWTSSDTTVARIDGAAFAHPTTRLSTIRLIPRKAGTITLTAAVEGKSSVASLTVLVPVASVIIVPATATIAIGATQPLTATQKDSVGGILTGRTVLWSSSDTTLATVSSTGLVTAKSAGNATITATSEGKAGTATITILAPVASVAVSPATASVVTGSTQQLTATLRDAAGTILTGRTVTWSSSNTAAATVSNTGLVTAIAAGTSTITASSEGKTATVAITITRAANTVISDYTFDGSLANLGELGPAVAGFTPTYVTDRFARAGRAIELKFSSAIGQQNLSLGELRHAGAVTIATWLKIPSASFVSMTMLIAAQPSAGMALNVYRCGSFSTQCKTAGTGYLGIASNWTGDNLSAPSIRFVDTTTAISAGEWYHLAVTMDSAGTATLYVNGKSVATRSGMSVPAYTATSAVIGPCEADPCTAHLDDFQIIAGALSPSAIATLAGAQAIASIAVSPATATLVAGSTQQLAAEAKDASGTTLTGRAITWTSSTPAVATVSSSGLVTAVAVGSATITATSEGKSGTAVVTVQATTEPPNRSIVFNNQALNVGRVTITGTTSGSLGAGVHPIQLDNKLFFRGGFGDNRVYTSTETGGSRAVLINSTSWAPDLTPSGTTLLIHDGDCGAANSHTIATANTDGTNVQRIANLCALTPARWSPDNTKIAYQTEQGIEIYTLATSAKQTILTLAGNSQLNGWRWYGNVAWSADGTRLSFIARTGAPEQYCLFTVQVSGANLQKAPSSCGADLGYHDWDWETGLFVVEMNSGASSALHILNENGAYLYPISNTTGATWPRWTRSGATVPVATITVTPSTASLTPDATRQLTAVTKDAAGTTLSGRTVTWSSSNTAIATVSTAGLVTAKAIGTVTIRATSDGKSGDATINVVSADLSSWIYWGENGHYYKFIPASNISWDAAKTQAAATSISGFNAQLASVATTGEQGFVADYLKSLSGWTSSLPYIWFGLFQDTSSPTFSEPAGGWRWLSGEPFDGSTIWSDGEPNNAAAPESCAPLSWFTGSSNRTKLFVDFFCTGTYVIGYVIELSPVTEIRSCKDVQLRTPTAVSGTYSIYPDGTASSQTTAFCDMTTDGGGWTKVLGHKITNNVSRAAPATNVVDGLRLASVDSGMVGDANLSTLRTQIGFAEMRFLCSKPSRGRTLHLKTSNINVLDWLTRRSNIQPASVGSFTKLGDDTSVLTGDPARWGGDTNGWFAGKWGVSYLPDEQRATHYPIMIASLAHWAIVGHENRMECDDWNSQAGYQHNGSWSVFVR